MPPNRYAAPEVLGEIRRLKAALHRESKTYVCEPDPPGMWSKHGGKRWQNMSAEEKDAAKAKLRGSTKLTVSENRTVDFVEIWLSHIYQTAFRRADESKLPQPASQSVVLSTILRPSEAPSEEGGQRPQRQTVIPAPAQELHPPGSQRAGQRECSPQRPRSLRPQDAQ